MADNNWLDIKGYTNRWGFKTENSEILLSRILKGLTDEGDTALDFFAGSGTTAAVAHKLRRKWVTVEMGSRCFTIILPRLKHVLFGEQSGVSRTVEWRGGGFVKVIRLESYEDALNNLTFDEENDQQALKLFGDDDLLPYMLKWETYHSEPLLNVEQLQSPFSYRLHIHHDGEMRERLVDLPETFAYLLGLDVQTRRAYYGDSGQRYLVYRGTLRDGCTVAVIWRETKGWAAEDYERDRAFVAEQKLAEGADEVYVHGGLLIPSARSLDLIFKERMFAGVEA
jgi:adenine-specific DNA-methyltransferase